MEKQERYHFTIGWVFAISYRTTPSEPNIINRAMSHYTFVITAIFKIITLANSDLLYYNMLSLINGEDIYVTKIFTCNSYRC